MRYSDYQRIIAEGFDIGVDSSLVVKDFHTQCAVDDHIALKLTSVSPKYVPGSVILITKAGSTLSFADLVVCKGQPFEYGRATFHASAAYLKEIELSDIGTQGTPSRDYVFKHSYVVVSTINFAEYDQHYRKGSGIWGMFTHAEDQATQNSPHRATIQGIVASPDVKFMGPLLEDLVFRAVAHASPLERFLKLYHLLEINFDVQMVDAIKALGTDLKGMGKIIKELNSGNEFDRLLKMIRKTSQDVPFFVGILTNIFFNSIYHAQLNEMLFEYGKDSNPYSKVDTSKLPTLFSGGFSAAAISAAGLSINYDHLTKFTAYILYRFRCSIAHAKIGEYLLTTDDENFICDIAEPATIAILVEIYKSSP